ncbi:MAG: choice-of-anchor Q domain-containing protein [Bacteroidota bacterium]|nr:choice-of-anchor Q domain-containing protein [Bacteroidota bacterium]
MANANWKLMTGCPAIDAGTDLTASGVTSAIDGVARPQGAAFDMGAYERSGLGTGINESVNNSVKCYGPGQSVQLQGVAVGKNVDIYGVTGNLLYSKIAANTSISISSESGVYLVRVSGNVSKVLLK